MAHYTMDQYKTIPPDRPYCWSKLIEFNKNSGSQVCKQCGFRDECKENQKKRRI
jgi:hypothetical protein